jgi:HEAT repeat protein
MNPTVERLHHAYQSMTLISQGLFSSQRNPLVRSKLLLALCGMIIWLSLFKDAVGQTSQPPQTRYKGKTTAQLIQIMAGVDTKKSIDAGYSLNTLGFFRPEVISVLRRGLTDKSEGNRENALGLVGMLGAKASPVVPELINILKTDVGYLRTQAVGALGAVEPAPDLVLPVLLASLDDPDSMIRGNAAWALGKLGPGARAALPRLRKLVSDKDAFTRAQTVLALWSIDQQEPDIGVLVNALQSEDFFGSFAALFAIKELRQKARAAVPALLARLRDVNPPMRTDIALALWKIEKDQPAVLPALLEILELGGDNAFFACRALGEIGSDAKAAVPQLLKASKKDDAAERLASTKALWQICEHQDCIPIMIKLLEKDREASAAADFLAAIGPKAKSAVPALLVAIGSANELNCYCAAGALLRIDPAAAAKAGIK